MRKLILAATIVGFSTAGALAQTTGPSGQDSTKMGTQDQMSGGMKKEGMSNGMKKDGMSGTSGMSNDKMGMKDKSKENKPVDGSMKK